MTNRTILQRKYFFFYRSKWMMSVKRYRASINALSPYLNEPTTLEIDLLKKMPFSNQRVFTADQSPCSNIFKQIQQLPRPNFQDPFLSFILLTQETQKLRQDQYYPFRKYSWQIVSIAAISFTLFAAYLYSSYPSLQYFEYISVVLGWYSPKHLTASNNAVFLIRSASNISEYSMQKETTKGCVSGSEKSRILIPVLKLCADLLQMKQGIRMG